MTINIPIISDFLTNQNISHDSLLNLVKQINHNPSTNIEYLIKIKISKDTIPNIITFNILIINTNFSFTLTSSYSLLLSIYNLITLLLLVTPSYTSFTIITNHSPLFNIYKYYSPNSRNNCKTPYLTSIINIHNIIKTKSSSFTVKKITAALKKTPIPNHNPINLIINPINSSIINAYDINNNYTPLPPLRNYLKKSNKLFNTINPINSTKTSSLYYHKPSTYTSHILSFQNIPKPKNNSESNLLNFHLKIITNTLPTKQYLNQKYPTLYTNDLCPSCKTFTENLNHILSCPSLTTSTSTFIQETQKILKTIIPTHLTLQLQNLFTHLQNPTNIFNLILDPNTIKNIIPIYRLNSYYKRSFQNQLLNLFKQTIWTQRNTNMIHEETQNNITKKIKYSPKITKKTKNNTKLSNNKKTKNTNTNSSNISNTIHNSTPNITSNNTNTNLISSTKLIKLTQIITSQNTTQQLHKKITLIVNEAIASSTN